MSVSQDQVILTDYIFDIVMIFMRINPPARTHHLEFRVYRYYLYMDKHTQIMLKNIPNHWLYQSLYRWPLVAFRYPINVKTIRVLFFFLSFPFFSFLFLWIKDLLSPLRIIAYRTTKCTIIHLRCIKPECRQQTYESIPPKSLARTSTQYRSYKNHRSSTCLWRCGTGRRIV